MSKYTTISITPYTKAKLDDIGKKSQTYDELIIEILKDRSS